MALLLAVFWSTVVRTIDQQLCLAAMVAAFAIGVAADLLILPRFPLWQIVPVCSLGVAAIWLPDQIVSVYHHPPNSVGDVALIGLLLVIVIVILALVVGFPAIVGATIPWSVRTGIVEYGQGAASRTSGIHRIIIHRRWPVVSRVAGVVIVLGTLTVPLMVPFHGTEGSHHTSPDGRYVAFVREFNCGATCPFNPWVVVRDRHDRQMIWFWLPEETIVFETESTAPSEIWLTWESERELTVRFVNHVPDAITIQKQGWHDMTITYEPVSP